MKRVSLLLLTSALLVLSPACDDEETTPDTSESHDMAGHDMAGHDMGMGGDGTVHVHQQALTDDGAFWVSWEYVDAEPGVREDFELLVSVYTADQSALVADAEVTFAPTMPSMGHGMDEDPVITANGDGTFAVTQLAFSMGGTWQFDIEVTSGDTTDTIAFEVACCG